MDAREWNASVLKRSVDGGRSLSDDILAHPQDYNAKLLQLRQEFEGKTMSQITKKYPDIGKVLHALVEQQPLLASELGPALVAALVEFLISCRVMTAMPAPGSTEAKASSWVAANLQSTVSTSLKTSREEDSFMSQLGYSQADVNKALYDEALEAIPGRGAADPQALAAALHLLPPLLLAHERFLPLAERLLAALADSLPASPPPPSTLPLTPAPLLPSSLLLPPSLADASVGARGRLKDKLSPAGRVALWRCSPATFGAALVEALEALASLPLPLPADLADILSPLADACAAHAPLRGAAERLLLHQLINAGDFIHARCAWALHRLVGAHHATAGRSPATECAAACATAAHRSLALLLHSPPSPASLGSVVEVTAQLETEQVESQQALWLLLVQHLEYLYYALSVLLAPASDDSLRAAGAAHAAWVLEPHHPARRSPLSSALLAAAADLRHAAAGDCHALLRRVRARPALGAGSLASLLLLMALHERRPVRPALVSDLTAALLTPQAFAAEASAVASLLDWCEYGTPRLVLPKRESASSEAAAAHAAACVSAILGRPG